MKTSKSISFSFSFSFLFVLTILFCLENSSGQEKKSIKYYGKDYFLLEGTTIPDSLKENRYDRLPASYKELVRPPVWNHSKSSTGLSIRFLTNSSSVKVKWEVLNDTKMNHMAETGIKGIDLYCKTAEGWQYINTGRPTGKINEFILIENMPVAEREFKMFLPLYDGLVNIEVGVDSLSNIKKSVQNPKKPIVFYGTSITQGGCASRPGMVFTNIISRKLDIDCINYGFSGNGRMEKPIAEVIAGIDASFYVIDCVGNMSAEEIHQNMIPLVEILRGKNPQTPIVFVESIYFEKSFFDPTVKDGIIKRNSALKEEYDKLIRQGSKKIYYITCEEAIGDDHEGTVDSVHLNDLGFSRMAGYLLNRFEKFGLVPRSYKR